jgi:hypothetical protein
VRCKHFSFKEVLRNRALTSKFVWTGAWPTLLFIDDSIALRIHSHDSNTHIAHTYHLVIDFEIRLDSLWQVLCSYPRCFTPAHHPAGLSARDRHRLSQHHPYDLALYLSLPPLSVWPGPTRPDLDPGPTSTTLSTGPARPGPTRSQARLGPIPDALSTAHQGCCPHRRHRSHHLAPSRSEPLSIMATRCPGP